MGYVRIRTLFQLMVFVCSALSSILSYLDQLSYVGFISALAAAITSWVGFTDLNNKTQRYTSAVTGIKKLQRSWATLTPVQQSDRRNVMDLVAQGEVLLNNEFSSWSAGVGKSKKKKGGNEPAKTQAAGS